MKKFVSGLIVGAIVTTTISTFASGVWDKIDVLKNDINVMVDGKQIFADNFVYNDTTYLPLRAVSEALNQPVEYDEATNTAYIGEKPVGSVDNSGVSNASNGELPDPLWIEKDGIRYTNDEFQFEISEEISPKEGENPRYAVYCLDITNRANEIVGKAHKYHVEPTKILDIELIDPVLEYKGETWLTYSHLSLECYYSTIQTWLRSLNQ